ncbi:DNA ligase D [Sphingomicrobium astaxanthinifaciens]|uniref:DNA ligase D n=1 Tax=Sphingomicrobium astaxanthinifaciens TaxID=1227949 RepID=UPI001FCA5DD6|nr:DNA ligase D [Sphingomicrobium astaxanthinifaciens]MCJ7421568.1 DNA ligase D [Sphingomicrobium astaxanthinifaciens]
MSYRPPQKATLSDHVPTRCDWLFEYKYDGYRLLLDTGDAVAWTKNGKDWSDRFAGLIEAACAHFPKGCLVDGEAVVLGSDGQPDFGALQRALRKSGGKDILFFAFDLIEEEGKDLTGLTNLERKARLEALMEGAPPPLFYAEHVSGGGEAMLEAVCREGGEGVIAKRAAAPYRHRRTRDWLKVKCSNRQEFVIVGWVESDKKARPFRSLLLGVHEDGALRYAGKVGTGFDHETMVALKKKLERLSRKTPPLEVPRGEAKEARWVSPKLVAEVAFTEFTSAGTLRHPSFLGLRSDKPARQVKRERALPTAAGVGVKVTSAERMVFAQARVTKGQLADYYAAIAPLLLVHAARRPLTLVRCPQGRSKHCFFQKHGADALGDAVHGVPIREKDGGTEDYLWVEDAKGLVQCAQMGTIEFHGWGSRNDALEAPDRLVFDLDPDEGLDFADVKAAAVSVRDILAEMGLDSWPLLTGGKGVHVVAPLDASAKWPAVKSFAERFARALAQDRPDRFTANIRKNKRGGKIFLDWLRNQRGATAVMPYSARAREGAPVAVPVSWPELASANSGHDWHVGDLEKLLRHAEGLTGWGKAKQSLPDL